jgi:hypothetical protein
MCADLFREIIPSILQTKKDMMQDELDEKEYQPFLVNRALSYHMDCIFHANQMNMSGNLDKTLQYKYLLHSVRAMKRKFQPWQKASALKDLACVKEYFGYNDEKAKDALRILTEDQIAEIKIRIDKGGVRK